MQDYATITRSYFQEHGRPLKVYVDRGKVFKVNHPNTQSITQYHRMLKELNVELIFAYSPQAKGRVERAFRTLQDRLVKELRLQKVTSIEQANSCLQEFLKFYNQQFSVEPKETANLHQPVGNINLNSIFCIKKTRILKEDYTIVYRGRWFQLSKKQPLSLKKGQQITVSQDFDGTIALLAGKFKLDAKEIVKKEPLYKEKLVKNRCYKPLLSHPWRNYPGKEKGDIPTLCKR